LGSLVPAVTKFTRTLQISSFRLKRFGDAKEVSGLIAFLVSDASFITGSRFDVDGGATKSI
jgi:NAD(P)-dependent dehydrogenase (short-subunit alcohol dehydrogenase family)